MRLFISVNLSEKMKKELSSVILDMKRSGAKANYTIPENMHLTLAFIGETDRINDILEALDELTFSAFKIRLNGFGHFGSLYWVGLEEQPDLYMLVKKIRGRLDAHNIPYDRKAFKAHITVARRVESVRPVRVMNPNASMEVRSFSLMKSERIRGRMKYTELAVWDAEH